MKILITYPQFFPGEATAITGLMEAYDFILHMRKPDASTKEYKDLLCTIPEQFHNRIVLHGGYELQNEFSVRGLHFSTTARETFASLNVNGTKSTSTHSFAEFENMDGQFDYMFLSPIFNSISKQGYTAGFNPDELKAFLQKERKSDVIALGGIDATTLPKLKEFNFDGYAVLGTVWTNSPSPKVNFNDNMNTIIHA